MEGVSCSGAKNTEAVFVSNDTSAPVTPFLEDPGAGLGVEVGHVARWIGAETKTIRSFDALPSIGRDK